MLNFRSLYAFFISVALLFVSLQSTPSLALALSEEAMVTNSSDTSSAAKVAPSTKVSELLEKLAINKGKGQFVQQKYFSFMSMPITSTGKFIVEGQSALWQTQQPVFSALLLTPDAIYRRLTLDENYQLLSDSAEFSGVLSTIFTGKVNADDWQISSSANESCLVLLPKSGQLTQLFKQVDLCLVKETQLKQSESETADNRANNVQQQRQITLTDSKGDKTVIMMKLSNGVFLSADSDALKLTPSQGGNISER